MSLTMLLFKGQPSVDLIGQLPLLDFDDSHMFISACQLPDHMLPPALTWLRDLPFSRHTWALPLFHLLQVPHVPPSRDMADLLPCLFCDVFHSQPFPPFKPQGTVNNSSCNNLGPFVCPSAGGTPAGVDGVQRFHLHTRPIFCTHPSAL